MSTTDMPPNAHSVGGGKKKNKKEKSSSAAATTAAATATVVATTTNLNSNSNSAAANNVQPVIQQIEPQPRPEIPKKGKRVVEERKETLKHSCDDLVDLSSDNDRSSQSSQTHEEVDVKVEKLIEKVTRSTENALSLIDIDNEEKPPPLAPPRRNHQAAKVAMSLPMPSPKSMNLSSKEMIPPRSRNSSVSYMRGQVVHQSEPMSPTIVGSVAELVQDVIPKSHPQAPSPAIEKAEWVQISSIEKAGNSKERLDVLVVGLLRGYQIWTFNQNGDCEEVLSVRQGPIRACQILPNNLKTNGKSDPYAAQRPLMAIVDATSPMHDRQYCTLQIVSLITGTIENRLTFDEQIVAINVTEQYLAVSLSNRVFIYENVTFSEVRHITTLTPMENCLPAMAITGQLLAFADRRLNHNLQSSGGLATEVEATNSDKYTDQMMSAVNMISRTVKSIGESMSATVTGTNVTKSEAAKGIVTVMDLTRNELEPTYGVMCHWVAHIDGISHISFSPDQRLVVTADSTATIFNVFLLLPHPETPTLAAVQHLYKLHRGNTPAKVSSTSFSIDSRWLAIATNHGTCHVFAICPFGGKPNQRTHGDLFVNKESRFHRSAGLTDVADVTATLGPSKQRAMKEANPFTKEHPVASMHKILARTNGNSRVGPFPPPLHLYAVKKIRDPSYSADNLTARAKDMTSLPISQNRRLDGCRVSVFFSSKSYQSLTSTSSKSPTLNLLIARADANAGSLVFEYELVPRQLEANAHGATNMEDGPKLKATQTAVWYLKRTKNNADMHVPMPAGSPIINMASESFKKPFRNPGEENWTPQVEYRTYLSPHRWIWQGPQFEFYSYNEDSAVLMSPHESHSFGSFKTIPVVLGADEGGSLYNNSATIPSDATRIECGSYTSTNSFNVQTSSSFGAQSDIQMKIADAMKDISSTSPVERDSIDYDADEKFYDTLSPTPPRNGSFKSKSKKAPPMCAPPPRPICKADDDNESKNENDDDDDEELEKFEMEDDEEEEEEEEDEEEEEESHHKI